MSAVSLWKTSTGSRRARRPDSTRPSSPTDESSTASPTPPGAELDSLDQAIQKYLEEVKSDPPPEDVGA